VQTQTQLQSFCLDESKNSLKKSSRLNSYHEISKGAQANNIAIINARNAIIL